MQLIAPADQAGTVPGVLRLPVRRAQNDLGEHVANAGLRQRRQPELAYPQAQHASLLLRLQRVQFFAGQDRRCVQPHLCQQAAILFAQQVAGLCAVAGALRQRGGGVRPAFAQQREHPIAQKIAIVAIFRIVGVLDPAQPVAAGVCQQRRAREFQQGSPELAAVERAPRPHRRQAIGSRAAQCAQQEGFRLIVQVVGKHEKFPLAQRGGEGGVPRRARRAFEAEPGSALHGDADDLQRHAQRRAFAFAMRRPGVGIGVQAVVDVNRAQVVVLRPEQMKQHGGIQPTAEPDQQSAPWSRGGWQPDAAVRAHSVSTCRPPTKPAARL